MLPGPNIGNIYIFCLFVLDSHFLNEFSGSEGSPQKGKFYHVGKPLWAHLS
jgi:hypothetical protein